MKLGNIKKILRAAAAAITRRRHRNFNRHRAAFLAATSIVLPMASHSALGKPELASPRVDNMPTRIFTMLVGNMGYSREAAAAIMGNIKAESGFVENKDSGVGDHYLLQWRYPRDARLIKSSGSNVRIVRGRPLPSINYKVQMRFADSEISHIPGLQEGFKRSHANPGYLARRFMQLFERPAANTGNYRAREALYYYNLYKNYAIPSKPVYVAAQQPTSLPVAWRIIPRAFRQKLAVKNFQNTIPKTPLSKLPVFKILVANTPVAKAPVFKILVANTPVAKAPVFKMLALNLPIRADLQEKLPTKLDFFPIIIFGSIPIPRRPQRYFVEPVLMRKPHNPAAARESVRMFDIPKSVAAEPVPPRMENPADKKPAATAPLAEANDEFASSKSIAMHHLAKEEDVFDIPRCVEPRILAKMNKTPDVSNSIAMYHLAMEHDVFNIPECVEPQLPAKSSTKPGVPECIALYHLAREEVAFDVPQCIEPRLTEAEELKATTRMIDYLYRYKIDIPEQLTKNAGIDTIKGYLEKDIKKQSLRARALRGQLERLGGFKAARTKHITTLRREMLEIRDRVREAKFVLNPSALMQTKKSAAIRARVAAERPRPPSRSTTAILASEGLRA